MHRLGRSWFAAALFAVAYLAACEPADLASRPPDKCAKFNGSFGNQVKGSLMGKQARGRAIARRMKTAGQSVTHPSLQVTLTPICENNQLDNQQLEEGRFVGILTGPGTAPRFSRIPDDTVFWWVFGEKIRLPNGRDTVLYYSEFFSVTAPPGTPYTILVPLQVCSNESRDGERAEKVDWHSGVCDTTAAHMQGEARLGDRPWFGCTRGCCFAQMTRVDSEGGSLPTDTLPRDTTRRRDTTRPAGGA